MIIYIHGFGSHGYGSKAKVFREYFHSIRENFIAPSLSYVPELAIQTLTELIKSYHGDVYLIGSSLGGFYATYLSQMPEVKKVVLINPATKPMETLSRALGDAPNFYDDSSFSWNQKHLEMLKQYDHYKPNYSLELEKFFLLLQKGDELLDYLDAAKKYEGTKLIIEDGGSHSFDGIKRHLESIRVFFEIDGKNKNSNPKKELYSTKIYKDILAFALKAHGEQKTPNGLPYSFHIVSVANEIINSLSTNSISYDNANIAIACALLHDVNEDTQERVDSKNIEFPENNIDVVVNGVAALTKNTSLPSKQEQMKDSLKRLKQMPKCVQMVKLADRITNLAPAPAFWNKHKRKAYVDEAKFILRELGASNKYLSDKLQGKIENYEIDFVRDEPDCKIVDNYLVFFADDKQLILDKSHKNYLKTFKAINRLSEYTLKEYDLELFTKWENKEEIEVYKNRVGISYVVKILNIKNLLDLNKQTDEKIDKYFTTILKGEDVIF